MKSIRFSVLLSLLSLLSWANSTYAGNPMVGMWQMNTPSVGESKLYVAEEAGKMNVQEFGLGYATGTTATFKDGRFHVHIEVDKDVQGYWEFNLNKELAEGTGETVFTHYPKGFGVGVAEQRAGRPVRVIKGVTIRRLSSGGFGNDWHIEYIPSHRATFERQWTYAFPNYQSKRWIIALRYAPELPWSKDAKGTAELLTSDGWKPFEETHEESLEKRRMLRIDYPHNDPKLRGEFTIRTTVTATICDQVLMKGKPQTPIPSLSAVETKPYLQATAVYDFDKPEVKKWMDEHDMWLHKGEHRMDFALRVRKELREKLPYDTKDGGVWICSQILKSGFGECCRHSMVAVSILRANKIPARTVCSVWAVDDKSQDGHSQAGHCWMELHLAGIGWVTCDSTGMCVGDRPGQLLGGMVDFDWVIDAGPYGKQTVAGIDTWPAFWGEGKGDINNNQLVTETATVHVLERFR